MGIHYYVWLYLENEEVEEEKTPPPQPEEHQAGIMIPVGQHNSRRPA
jgi:hypothetical protein